MRNIQGIAEDELEDIAVLAVPVEDDFDDDGFFELVDELRRKNPGFTGLVVPLFPGRELEQLDDEQADELARLLEQRRAERSGR